MPANNSAMTIAVHIRAKSRGHHPGALAMAATNAALCALRSALRKYREVVQLNVLRTRDSSPYFDASMKPCASSPHDLSSKGLGLFFEPAPHIAVVDAAPSTSYFLGIIMKFMNHDCTAILALAGFCLLSSCIGASAETRYFRVCPDMTDGGCGSPNAFVVALDSATQIQKAQDIIHGKVTDQVHVQGNIISRSVSYNSPWRFYLDPATIQFFTFAHPICWNYSTTEVNANLNKVGTPGFLPTRGWCPRGYRLSAEVPAVSANSTYFMISDGKSQDSFVIALTNPDKIQQARAIANGAEHRAVHVSGTIVKAAAPYNPAWHFYLAPASISFFESAIEVCDATTSNVEGNLQKVGGAFLPGSYWCPWSSKVTREVPSNKIKKP